MGLPKFSQFLHMNGALKPANDADYSVQQSLNPYGSVVRGGGTLHW